MKNKRRQTRNVCVCMYSLTTSLVTLLDTPVPLSIHTFIHSANHVAMPDHRWDVVKRKIHSMTVTDKSVAITT